MWEQPLIAFCWFTARLTGYRNHAFHDQVHVGKLRNHSITVTHICGQFQVFLNFPHYLLYFHWFQVYSSNFLFLTTDPCSQLKIHSETIHLKWLNVARLYNTKNPQNFGLFCVMGEFTVFRKKINTDMYL